MIGKKNYMEDLLTAFIDSRQFMNITVSQLALTLATLWYANVHYFVTEFDQNLINFIAGLHLEWAEADMPKCLHIDRGNMEIVIILQGLYALAVILMVSGFQSAKVCNVQVDGKEFLAQFMMWAPVGVLVSGGLAAFTFVVAAAETTECPSVYQPLAICNAIIFVLAIPNIYWKHTLNRRKDFIMAQYAIREILDTESEHSAESDAQAYIESKKLVTRLLDDHISSPRKELDAVGEPKGVLSTE